MSQANKIFTNTVWQVVIRVVNILIGVFYLGLITRLLGISGFGFYTTIFAFVQTFMVLTDFGLYMALLREISTVSTRDEESKITSNIFTIRVLASILMLIMTPALVWFFPYTYEVKLGVAYFAGAFFFQSLISTLTAVFAKKLDMAKVAFVDLFNKIAYAIAIYFIFINQGSLNQVLGYHSLVFLFSFLLLYIFIRQHVSLRLKFDFVYWRKVFKIAWPLATTVVLNLIYFKADTLILSGFKSPQEVGLYGAPYRVLEVLATFPHMFMSLILPIFTVNWINKNTEKLRQVIQYNFDFFSILTIGLIAGTWLVSRPAMILLSGKDFAASGPILNVLILATAMIFFGVLFTYLVVALDLQRQMIKYFALTAILGLVGYFIFIPLFSYWGAAYVTLLVETCIVIFSLLVIRQKIKLALTFKIFAKSILSGLVAFMVAWSLLKFNALMAALAFVIIYFLALYFFRAIDKASFKEILKKS